MRIVSCSIWEKKTKFNYCVVVNLLQKEKKNIVEEKGAEQQRDFSPWQKFFLVLISFSSLIITEKTFVSLTEGLGNGTSVLLKQD